MEGGKGGPCSGGRGRESKAALLLFWHTSLIFSMRLNERNFSLSKLLLHRVCKPESVLKPEWTQYNKSLYVTFEMRDGNDDLNPEKSFMNFFLWFASATLSGITALQHSPYLMNPYNFFIYSPYPRPKSVPNPKLS